MPYRVDRVIALHAGCWKLMSSKISRAAFLGAFALAALLVGGAAAAQTPPTPSPPPGVALPVAPDTSGAAPASAPPTGAVKQEIGDNPYGLSALWNGGDFVARGTLVLLVIMSVGSWYVIITKLIEQTVLLRQAREANRSFWSAASVRLGADGLSKRSAFRMIVEDGLRASDHHEGTLTEQIDLHSWIT